MSAALCYRRTTNHRIDAHMDGIRKHSLHGHHARVLHAARDHDLHAKAVGEAQICRDTRPGQLAHPHLALDLTNLVHGHHL